MKFRILLFLLISSSAYAQEHPPIALKRIAIVDSVSLKEFSDDQNLEIYLNANGTFKETYTVLNQVKRTETGSYTLKGNLLTLNNVDGVTETSVIKQLDAGITKIIAKDGTTFYYLRKHLVNTRSNQSSQNTSSLSDNYGPGGAGAGLHMPNWRAVSAPDPKNVHRVPGTVIIDFTVDERGNVLEAHADKKTTADLSLIQSCVDAIKATKFQSKTPANGNQRGQYTFLFRVD